MQLQTTQEGLGLPFGFTRLAGFPGHVLQLENSLENLDDDLEHQLRTQGPNRSLIADPMLPRARMIGQLGLCNRAPLDGHKDYRQDEKNSRTRIDIHARDVDVEQVTSAE